MQATIAYIDGANLNKGVKSEGWKINYAKLRKWLTDKYNVQKAYIFLGMRPEFSNLKIRSLTKRPPQETNLLKGSFLSNVTILS